MVGDTTDCQTGQLRCDVLRTFRLEYLLLGCILIIDAAELEAILLSCVLRIRDLDDAELVTDTIATRDDLVFVVLRLQQGS